MLLVEEVFGIARIKCKRLETGEGTENRRGPLPSVAHHLRNTERAIAGGRGIDVDGIPPMKIEVATAHIRRRAAPRIGAFRALGRAVRRPMKLRFGRQRSFRPARVIASFLVCYVNRRVQRQRYFGEHTSIEPFASAFDPEIWRRRTGANEFQILTVGDLVLTDRKCRHVHTVFPELVSQPNSPACWPKVASPCGMSILSGRNPVS